MNKYMKSTFIENGYINALRKRENTFVDTHFHDFFEMEYILSGSGTYTVDGTAYPVEAGDLFFLTPLNFHCVDIRCAELYNVMFSGNICSGTFLQSLTKNAPIALKTKGQTGHCFEVLLQELCQSADDQELSITLLNAILGKLERETVKESREKNLNAVSRAELYILTNFRNEISLNEVANEVALAPTYFSRLFKAKTGVNFKTYLNNMRFEYAKKLLDHSDMTVMQVCADCGFKDYPNFIRRFKQHTGLYPAQYRKSRQPGKTENIEKAGTMTIPANVRQRSG